MRTIERIFSITVSLIFLLSSVSCTASNNVDNSKGYNVEKIKINAVPSHMMSMVIKELDLLTPYLPEGVITEWVDIRTGPEMRDALVSGDIDVTILPSMTVISAINNDIPLRLFSGNSVYNVSIFSQNSAINSIESLKDSSGIYISTLVSMPHLTVMAMCKDSFGDANYLNDKLVPLALPDSVAAFNTSDQMDCIIATFPYTITVASNENAKLLLDLSPVADKYGITNYFTANQDFYENNPLLIEAFRKAQIDSINLMNDEPERVAGVLAEVFGISVEDVIEELSMNAPVVDDLKITGFDELSDLLLEAGVLENEPVKFADLPNVEDIPQ